MKKRAIFLMMLFFILLFAGCGGPSFSADEVAKDTEMPLKQKVEQIIIGTLGEKTNGKDTLIKVSIFDAGEGNNVQIHFNSRASTEYAKLSEAAELMENMFKLEDINEVTLFSYETLVDNYGKEHNDVVMKIGITQDIEKEINWENFNPENFPKIASVFWEHPAIK